jgi:hypothetical protein
MVIFHTYVNVYQRVVNFCDLSHHFTMGGFRSCILWLLIVSFAIYGLGATVAVVLENVPWIC